VGWIRRGSALIALLLCLGAASASAQQQSQPQQPQQPNEEYRQVMALPWQKAPSVGRLGSVAEISLDNGLRYLDAPSTSKFLELNGNPPRDNDFVVAPGKLHWFAVFAFDPSGYVRDDETLDNDAMLKALKAQNEESIAERKKLNLPILTLQGWSVPPHYDSETHRLEWGTKLTDPQGEETVNYTVRLLGRSGVMSATLVSDPVRLDGDIKQFKAALKGFSYVAGESYSEFRQGDRVAAYGLGALVVGGAAAVATSTGLLKGLGKFIGIAVFGGAAAVAAAFKSIFRRVSRRQ
jgi:uncharacterized membrane-anchored protein